MLSAFSETSELTFERQEARRRASIGWRRFKSATGMMPNMSSISLKKRTCFEAILKGQTRNNDATTSWAKPGSFSVNFLMQSSSCEWNAPSHSTFCRGRSTFVSTS